MASIAKRPDGSWRARYRDAAKKEHTKHFARKVDAQHWLDSVTAAVQTGTYVDASRSRMTAGDLAAIWLSSKVNLKPTTRALYASVLDVHVLPRWSTTKLDAVEHVDVQRWVAELTALGLSGAHVRKIHGVLLGIFGLAVRDRRTPFNQAAGVNLPRALERRRRYLSAVEVEALARAAGPGKVAIHVLSYCGLRWSELAGLRVGAVDLVKRRLDVREAMTEINGGKLVFGTPKSHERRQVPLPGFLNASLETQTAGKDSEQLVFTTTHGAPLRNRTPVAVGSMPPRRPSASPGWSPTNSATPQPAWPCPPAPTSRLSNACSAMHRRP